MSEESEELWEQYKKQSRGQKERKSKRNSSANKRLRKMRANCRKESNIGQPKLDQLVTRFHANSDPKLENIFKERNDLLVLVCEEDCTTRGDKTQLISQYTSPRPNSTLSIQTQSSGYYSNSGSSSYSPKQLRQSVKTGLGSREGSNICNKREHAMKEAILPAIPEKTANKGRKSTPQRRSRMVGQHTDSDVSNASESNVLFRDSAPLKQSNIVTTSYSPQAPDQEHNPSELLITGNFVSFTTQLPGNATKLATYHGKSKPLKYYICLLYTSPSPRDRQKSRMPSSA